MGRDKGGQREVGGRKGRSCGGLSTCESEIGETRHACVGIKNWFLL